jgi:hypothetical protein
MVLARAPVEHRAYNANARICELLTAPARALPRAPVSKSPGSAFAIRDCDYDLCTQWRRSVAVIVAAAITNVIRQCAAKSVS